MPDWYLNRALTNWRNAVNAAYPNRDKASDGTIGDAAHQDGTSDHNPDSDGSVDAWDMDVDLRSGNDAAAIEALKDVFERHPAARYWIHNRVIAHRNTGWRRERYTGVNPHDKHVHWNSNEATEDSTAPWDLEDDMTRDELREDLARLLQALTFSTNAVFGPGAHPWMGEAGYANLPKLAKDVAELKARPAAGTVEITDEQLERVLRKVLGMAPAA